METVVTCYLEALVVFGSVTGLDPRSLGDNECSGYELGLSPAQVGVLEKVAFDELAVDVGLKPAPPKPATRGEPVLCQRPR